MHLYETRRGFGIVGGTRRGEKERVCVEEGETGSGDVDSGVTTSSNGDTIADFLVDTTDLLLNRKVLQLDDARQFIRH